MHVTADGQPFIVVQLKAKGIQQFNGTLAVMGAANIVVALKTGGAKVVQKGYDTAAVIG